MGLDVQPQKKVKHDCYSDISVTAISTRTGRKITTPRRFLDNTVTPIRHASSSTKTHTADKVVSFLAGCRVSWLRDRHAHAYLIVFLI